MLKTVKHSGNKKTGPIAVTYRAGGHNVFATCPATCALNPQGEHAAWPHKNIKGACLFSKETKHD
jgi:hypothetical protein